MPTSLDAAASPASTRTTGAAPRSGGLGPGLVVALVSAAAFGLSGTLAHAMLSIGWTPAAVVAVRIGGAFVVLLVPCLLVVRRTGLPHRRETGRLLAYGVVAVAGAQLCYFSAVQYLSVGVALLLEYLAPVLLIAYHWAHDRRAPRLPVLAGAVLALAGLALVLDLRHGITLNPVGVVWGLAAAVCLTAYFVLGQDDGHRTPVPPLLMTTVGTGVGGAVLGLIGLFGVLPMHVATDRTELGGTSVPWWVPILLLVGVSAVLSYLTGIIAVRKLGSSLASFVALVEVIFAVVFAALLLGQQPSADQLLGGVLILAGIAAVQAGSLLPGRRDGVPA